MRVYARHKKDVATALTNLRDYREIAETQGAIRPSNPLARLTEARHALQSALLPQPGVHNYQDPARRQRDLLRAAEEMTRATRAFAAESVDGHNQSIEMTGSASAPSLTSAAAIDDRVKAIAEKTTAPKTENQAFLDKRLVEHLRDATIAITHVERSYQLNGPGATTQALAIAAAGQITAIAYTQEAKHEGASLLARHTDDEFTQLHKTPTPAPAPTVSPRPAPGP
ncbi:MAG TPA: hypothetical protein DFI00_04000 [Rhodospirillaceae bacterium]|nr:hypothetical protein [Alphaproteobacteria bacterium]OUT41781.1 MAG: hypothetical protein CBB62_05565 [Micavibrio sp. TMED2]HCI46437.1 hypothetical protein [Rhodospirillaceae bacterium]MAS46635.1 hypothetical protein [Alphaproteobacteria bacterium]MAX94729.1 hypothetical protein [Alphaproteobacteria bacterium]|tara:strand:- start:14548 stop:15225 length:678 start_codon:yes stop_codon:yes gene_type:complete